MTERRKPAFFTLQAVRVRFRTPLPTIFFCLRLLALQPGATIAKLLAKVPFKDSGDSLHLAECLRLAEMRE